LRARQINDRAGAHTGSTAAHEGFMATHLFDHRATVAIMRRLLRHAENRYLASRKFSEIGNHAG
jgi:hypothetical protein